MDFTVGILGSGNMGRCLIGGLIADGMPLEHIYASDIDSDQLASLTARYAVQTVADNKSLVDAVDLVVLAVKPQILRSVAEGLAAQADLSGKLFVSIAAGVRSTDLAAWLGGGASVVRAMPNTPALVGSAASALYADEAVSAEHREMAESVLRAVGIVQWIGDEGLMDAVTAVSGSGPAYFFLFIEVLEKAARELGLPAETARLLSIETAFGAAKMALESNADPGQLRAQVTSPGGTTERALQTLVDSDFEQNFIRAIRAANERSRELAEMFAQQG